MDTLRPAPRIPLAQLLAATIVAGPRVFRNALREDRATLPFRKPGQLIGRNDECPCGSGRKFKRCCKARKRAA
jgi:preprotein translocase subunit SecA